MSIQPHHTQLCFQPRPFTVHSKFQKPFCFSNHFGHKGQKCLTLFMTHMSRHSLLSFAALLFTPFGAQSFNDERAENKLDLPVFKTTSSGLKFLDIKDGSGNAADYGSKITFHYRGRLAGRQGKPFEDTYSDEPYRVVLGKDKIIAGLEEGLLGMKEGGKRRLLIPSSLGYTDRWQHEYLHRFHGIYVFHLFCCFPGPRNPSHAVSVIASGCTGFLLYLVCQLHNLYDKCE